MGRSLVLTGAHIKLYINNKPYKTVQAITLNVDYGENQIYGIDSAYAQEIAPTKVDVRGSVSGLRVKYSGGLQGSDARPLFVNVASSPYISIRIQDRSTGEDIFFSQNCKITRENHSAAVKGTYKLNFDWVAQIPLFALDRSE